MSSNQIQPQNQVKDSVYLKIWRTEQQHVRTRWTVVTFFLSISFGSPSCRGTGEKTEKEMGLAVQEMRSQQLTI